jgi:KTSC domain
MAVTWRSVFSSHIDSVGHDDETGEMLVQWSDGKISAYEGVSAEKVDEISKSHSVGDVLRQEIKPNFKHRYRE